MNASSDKPQRRRWWLPSVNLSVWLVFFVGLVVSNWRSVMISADGDPCMHWRIGDWMIEHRQVIRSDQFSHTRPGAPVVTMEWLSEIVFAAAGSLLGWNGIVLLSSTLIAATMCLLHRQLLSEGNEILLSTGFVLLVAMNCAVHWLARPHLVSHLLVAVWAWQLRQFDRNRIVVRVLFGSLVPLTVLWVNLHAGVFTALALIGVYLAGQSPALLATGIDRRTATRKMVVLGLLGMSCLLATLLNPNGWKLHTYIADFLNHPALVGSVNEFRSPDFHSDGMHGFVLLLGVLAVTLTVTRPRLTFTEVLLIGWSIYSALRWARNVPISAIVVTPILAEHLNSCLRMLPDSGWARFYHRLSCNIRSLDRTAGQYGLAVFTGTALVLIAAKPRLCGGEPVLKTEVSPNRFPVAAVEYYLKSPEIGTVLGGEMFNDYGWGGYLMFALPGRKVFIDGRNDLYGLELLEEFDKVNEPQPGWEAVFEKYKVGWTILPSAHCLNRVLERHADWKLVWADGVATIFARKHD